MKKFLTLTSLLLAAVLLLGMIPASAEVANAWEVPEGVEVYYANDISDKAAPTLDGEISDGEYGDVTVTMMPADRLTRGANDSSDIDDSRANQPTSDYVDFYFAYDDAFIYIAVEDYGGTWAEGSDTYNWLQETKAENQTIYEFAARNNYHFQTGFYLNDVSSYFSMQASSRGFDENKWFDSGTAQNGNADVRFGNPKSIVNDAYIKKTMVADGEVFADAPGGFKNEDGGAIRGNINQFEGQYKAVIELKYEKEFVMNLINELYADEFVELPNAMWFWTTLRTYVAGEVDGTATTIEGNCLAYNTYFATDIRDNTDVDYSVYGVSAEADFLPNLIVFGEEGDEISEGRFASDVLNEEEEEEDDAVVTTAKADDDADADDDKKDDAADKKDDAKTTTAAAEEEEDKKGGCGSVVGLAGIALVATLGTCTVFVAKKKED